MLKASFCLLRLSITLFSLFTWRGQLIWLVDEHSFPQALFLFLLTVLPLFLFSVSVHYPKIFNTVDFAQGLELSSAYSKKLNTKQIEQVYHQPTNLGLLLLSGLIALLRRQRNLHILF
jgi:hypothetical protein